MHCSMPVRYDYSKGRVYRLQPPSKPTPARLHLRPGDPLPAGFVRFGDVLNIK